MDISFKDSSTTGWLPDEILIQIIGDLQLRDRKNTRLVCRKWFALNNVREISKKEKFYCYGHSDRSLDVVLEIIEHTKRSTLNLEFIDFNFSAHTTRLLLFWTNHGSRVESLSFEDCTFSDLTLRYVFKYCDEMRHLGILYPRWDLKHCGECEIVLGFVPEELVLLGTRGCRPHLSSLKLKFYDDRCMSDAWLRILIYNVYPNIEHFSFTCTTALAHMTKRIADSKSTLKSFSVKSNYRFCPEMRDIHIMLMEHSYPKLTVMSNICLKLRPEHEIYDFLPRHNQLRSVKFDVKISRNRNQKKSDKALLERLMNCLLDSCPQLRSLQIRISGDVCLSDCNIFRKIKNSNLESLNLNFKLKVRRSDRKAVNINDTLKFLHLSVNYRFIFNTQLSRLMMDAFIKTFRGLSELIIDGPGLKDYLLQDIFLYQRQLTKLKLSNIDSIPGLTDYGFTGILPNGQRTGHSIKDLQKLQSLDLREPNLRVTSQLLDELQFLNLSSLFLWPGSSPKLREEDIVRTFSNLQNLEALKIVEQDFGMCCFSTWLKVCQHLKKLKYFVSKSYFYQEGGFDEKDVGGKFPYGDKFHPYARFFEKCPTLRLLYRTEVYDSRAGQEIFDYRYTYDSILGRVRQAEKFREQMVPRRSLPSGLIRLSEED